MGPPMLQRIYVVVLEIGDSIILLGMYFSLLATGPPLLYRYLLLFERLGVG